MSLPLVGIIIKDLFFWIYQASRSFFVPCYLIPAAVPRIEYAWKERVRNQLVSPSIIQHIPFISVSSNLVMQSRIRTNPTKHPGRFQEFAKS